MRDRIWRKFFSIAVAPAVLATFCACSGGGAPPLAAAFNAGDSSSALARVARTTPATTPGPVVAAFAAASSPGPVPSPSAVVSMPQAFAKPVVTVNASSQLTTSHAAILGVNSSVRFESASSDAEMESPLAAIGTTGGRWPGGTIGDLFNWKQNQTCTSGPAIQDPSATFDAYMTSLEQPLRSSVEITTDYGTGNFPACDQPGDPALAAAWVTYANATKNYGIKWWEVGNEVYEPAEPDKHSPANSASAYVANEPAFYTQMKAADPSINVGIPVTGSNWSTFWNTTVLKGAKYDYVSYHFYPERAGSENDATLLASPQTTLRNDLALIRSQLAAVGRPNVPISVSEWNTVPAYPGKQSVSIVSGLFAAETLGEMLDDGITRAEVFSDFGCNQAGVNNSSALYGWQNFGAMAVLSESTPDSTDNLCPSANATMPYGTPYPMGRAFQLLAQSGFASDGQQVLATSSSRPDVLSYAVSHGNGYQVMLINTNQNATIDVPVQIDGLLAGTSYNWLRYGKAEYDQSASGNWVGLTRGNGLPWIKMIPAVLPPWSVTVYTIPN